MISPISHWHDSKLQAQSISLIIHGLNLCPSKMDSLAFSLNEQRSHCLLIHLSGHDQNKLCARPSLEQWLCDFDTAYQKAFKRASKMKIPLYFLGHSMGNLLALYSESLKGPPLFSKRVMLAPCFEIPIYYKVIQPLLRQLPNSFSLPSFAPKKYRAHGKTPITSYKALFTLISHFKKNLFELFPTETLIFLNPKDELLDYQKTVKKISTQKLKHWRIKTTTRDHKIKETPNHLFIDPFSVGDEAYKNIILEIKAFLKN